MLLELLKLLIFISCRAAATLKDDDEKKNGGPFLN